MSSDARSSRRESVRRIPSGVCQTASGEVQLTPAGEVCVLSGTDSISTVLQEVGYPYAVSFKICPDENAPNSSILFKGPHSVCMPIGKTKAAWLSVVTAIHLCFIPIICPKVCGVIFV